MTSEPHSIPDEELARQTQAGSHPAFEELVCRYEHRLFAFVAQFCGRGSEARDLTQETFVKAFQAIAQFNPRHTFAAWLFTIARRKCIDHFRALQRISEEPPPELADPNDPAELLATNDDRRNLWETARRLLPETQFQALWLKYVEEMSVAQLACVLGKTQAHVKVILFRARRALGRELEKAQAGPAPAPPRTAVPPPAEAAGLRQPRSALDRLAVPATPTGRFTPGLSCL